MEEMTLRDILEYLDGEGLIITDWELIENALDNLEYDTSCFLRNPSAEQ